MRDLKHLGRRKAFRFPRIISHTPAAHSNSPRRDSESPRGRFAFLRVVLPMLAVILVAYPVFSLISSSDRKASPVVKKKPLSGPVDPLQSLNLAVSSLQRCSTSPAGKIEGQLPDGCKTVLTIDPQLQEKVTRVMEQNRVPYGAFVAVEPKTGKILALAGHSSIDPAWGRSSCFGTFPMASLFKIVTAAAAMEQKKVGPDSVVAFRGKNTSENPRYWDVRSGRGAQQVNLSLAMGKSINPVFGRLASDVVGRDSMMSMAQRFGFNDNLFPGTPVSPSRAVTPQNDFELKLMGAGLVKEVKISPLHAAVMMGALANGGEMMLPQLAEKIVNAEGQEVYQATPKPLRRVLDEGTTRQIAKALSLTVRTGTSRKAFHDRRGRPKLSDIDVAAKTGSISGTNPQGHYSWFAAYASAENPEMALVALVINQDKWKIKASTLGEQALETFFR